MASSTVWHSVVEVSDMKERDYVLLAQGSGKISRFTRKEVLLMMKNGEKVDKSVQQWASHTPVSATSKKNVKDDQLFAELCMEARKGLDS